jgi:hypothetical protein
MKIARGVDEGATDHSCVDPTGETACLWADQLDFVQLTIFDLVITNRQQMGPPSASSDDESAEELEEKRNYMRWKTLVPFLYDFFTHSNLAPWPSYSCR